MNLTQAQKIYPAIKSLVDKIMQKNDTKSAYELLLGLRDDVLNQADEFADTPIYEKFKDLESRLKALAFVHLFTQRVPNIFEEDIAYILDKDLNFILQKMQIYFERFNLIDDIQKQQKLLLEKLLSNKQRLTIEPIITEDGKKINPSVSNWLKYFYKKVGSSHNIPRIKIAEFLSKDKNLNKLSEQDKKKIKNLIALQNFLQQPPEVIMNMNEELIIEDENGNLILFSGGDFIVLSRGETQEEKKIQTTEQVKQKLTSKPKQKPKPKEIELKPIFSAVDVKAPTPPIHSDVPKAKDTVKLEEKIKEQIKPINPEDLPVKKDNEVLFKRTSEILTKIQKPKQKELQTNQIQKQDDLQKVETKETENQESISKILPTNKDRKTNLENNDTENVNKESVNYQVLDKSDSLDLYKKIEQVSSNEQKLDNHFVADYQSLIETEVAGDNTKIIEIFKQDLQRLDLNRIIALLKIIANHNLWKNILYNKSIQEFIQQNFDKQKFNQILNQENLVKQVQLFLKFILQDILKISISDSAKIASEICGIMYENGYQDFISMVYFDMNTEQFKWNDNL